jgi:flagellar basal body rod protein FlgG
MQGMVEKSNVSPVVEMTRMIKVSRSVGGITNVMKDLHEMQLRTIQTYGRQQ